MPAASYQRAVTGTCADDSAVASVNADGTVGCSRVRFYAGRTTSSYYGSDVTLINLPGIVTLSSTQCYSGAASAQLENASSGNVDLWYPGSSGTDSAFEEGNWSYVLTPTTVPSGTTYHLGVGTGTGAEVITITESQTQNSTAQTCTFQATAEVVTAS